MSLSSWKNISTSFKSKSLYLFLSYNKSQIAWLFTACYIVSKNNAPQHSHFEMPQNFLDHCPVHIQKNWMTSSSAYFKIENLIIQFQHVEMSIQSDLWVAYFIGHVWCAKHAGLLYFPINIDGSLWQHVTFAKTTSVPFASFFL